VASRPSVADRLPELVDAATAVFAEKGYKATQMADVATAMGVAAGSLYNYVEGKESLFALCLDSMMREGSPRPDLTLPLSTPPLDVTLRRLDERVKALLELPALTAALEGERPERGAEEELVAVAAELYDLLGRTRHATDMIERSARDLPELASLFYHEWRRPLLRKIRAYLESRMESGQFRRLDDVRVAAVFVLETAAWSASHRFHDPDGRRLDDASTRSTIIDLIVGTFMPREAHSRRRPAADGNGDSR
jgi:AcrR family transcriptional regulator